MDMTIDDLIQKTKIHHVRYYICSRDKEDTSAIANSDSDSESKLTPFVCQSRSMRVESESPSTANEEEIPPIRLALRNENLTSSKAPAMESSTPNPCSSTPTACSSTPFPVHGNDFPLSPGDEHHESSLAAAYIEHVELHQEPYFNVESQNQQIANDELLARHLVQQGPDDSEILFGAGLEDESGAADASSDATIPIEKNIKVRRGNCLNDIMKELSEPIHPATHVTVEMLLPNGECEAAEDNGGVLRDCLTEAWNTFYELYTLGNEGKVPQVRHDLKGDACRAIGRLISIGWRQEKYLPIKLSKPFMEYCVFGDVPCNDSIAMAFDIFLSPTDRNVLHKAVRNFQEVEQEELLETLQMLDCKKVAREDNLRSIIDELAFKEIIMKPKYVIDVWQEELLGLISRAEFETAYTELQPSNKRVAARLEFPADMDTEQQAVQVYLKRYVREANVDSLERFLRFTTGSNLLTVPKITVRFTKLSGLGRRPIAHTCGCVLELPVEYSTYNDFRSDFNEILNAGVWVMDIV